MKTKNPNVKISLGNILLDLESSNGPRCISGSGGLCKPVETGCGGYSHDWIHRDFRKPLIVMSPKNLLHHKDCKSNLSELDDEQGHPGFDKQGTRFKRLIKDQNNHSDLEEGIRRLILCSGKVYYELDEERKKVGRKDVTICRVEQLCPFPYDLIQRELKRYPKAEIVWCQEEPMNMGAYNYIAPRLCTAMKSLGRGNMDDIKYVGRAPSASTATGFYQVHVKEQSEIVQKALQLDPINYPL
ncbi:unnamed protein product [Cuscuta campestris]|uniref:2-oxoglutarate dehydrogenase E1 component/KDG C-terminal domain-containing protein n=1 Tax=Cuscuta campestris TaxID=132261 RepID=A0A484LZJ9_9ASTE|nr:unnamed protein product [Cuscuta campestris]